MTLTVHKTPKLLLHGGAGEWLTKDHDQVVKSIREAASIGWKALAAGGSALDAVEQSVVALEDNPLFDAGVGSYLNEKGEIEMDALIADGSTLRFGAVAAVQHVRNPVSLARLVMTRTDNCFFVAEGADQLAADFGLPVVPNIELITDLELGIFRRKHTTA